jgi:site-specific DNA-methyltransferase (adenine-specific)
MSGPKPYFEADGIALYLGDCREVIPALALQADLIVADPPYAETSLAWDRWPGGWLDVAATVSASLWCFGSMRMFLDRRAEFGGWKLSQDVIWEKNAGSGFQADRFKRIHEHALHWYRGNWGDVHHDAQREAATPTDSGREIRLDAIVRQHRGDRHHLGAIKQSSWRDDGTRLIPSVIRVKNLRGLAIHPTEKPIGILTPLIEYACPPGGVLLDPFAGSGSSLEAARLSGRRAIGIEAHEPYAEKAALRLSQAPLEIA